MRPIKVEFQAFGPYVGHETVDLEAVSSKGLFLICGKTGIGKTMILDAMTFALFGKSSGHGRDDFESMRCTNADFDTDTFVKLEFENHGEFYLFERRLERKRKNLSAAYNVSHKEDGIWRPLMENAKEKAVNDKAVELIGLEYEQFRQVIVLPQGQFERLLTSNSDEKEKILTSIFGEDKWQIIAEHFYDKAERRRSELKSIREKIKNSLAEEGCDSMSQLELAVTHKKDQAERLDDEYQKADYEKIIKEQQEILSLAKRFGDLHKAEERVKELEAKKEARTEWERSLNDAKRADKVRTFIETEEASAESIRKRKKEEETARKTAETKKESAEDASEKLKHHLEKEKDIEALKSNKIIFEGKRKDYEGLEEAERVLKAKKKVALDALDAENTAKEASDSLTVVIVNLQEGYATLQAEHEDLLNAYLAGITGELAGQLKKGKPCPVCGSTEHPRKAKAAENSVTKAKVDSKKKAAEQKYQELQDLDAKLKNLQEAKLRIQQETRSLNIRDVEQSGKIHEMQDEVARLEKRVALLHRIEDLDAVRELLQDGAPCPLCGAMTHPYTSGAVVPDPEEVHRQLAEAQKQLDELREHPVRVAYRVVVRVEQLQRGLGKTLLARRRAREAPELRRVAVHVRRVAADQVQEDRLLLRRVLKALFQLGDQRAVKPGAGALEPLHRAEVEAPRLVRVAGHRRYRRVALLAQRVLVGEPERLEARILEVVDYRALGVQQVRLGVRGEGDGLLHREIDRVYHAQFCQHIALIGINCQRDGLTLCRLLNVRDDTAMLGLTDADQELLSLRFGRRVDNLVDVHTDTVSII